MTDLLDNTKILILRVSKIGDRVRSFGLMASLCEMIETSEKHFMREMRSKGKAMASATASPKSTNTA